MSIQDIKSQKVQIIDAFKQDKVSAKELLHYQELSYQQNVLETFRAYLLSSKPMADSGKWQLHAKLFNGFCYGLVNERLYNVPDSKIAARDTSREEFQTAYLDRVFPLVETNSEQAYEYTSPEQYYADIKETVLVLANIFQAYRKIYL